MVSTGVQSVLRVFGRKSLSSAPEEGESRCNKCRDLHIAALVAPSVVLSFEVNETEVK